MVGIVARLVKVGSLSSKRNAEQRHASSAFQALDAIRSSDVDDAFVFRPHELKRVLWRLARAVFENSGRARFGCVFDAVEFDACRRMIVDQFFRKRSGEAVCLFSRQFGCAFLGLRVALCVAPLFRLRLLALGLFALVFFVHGMPQLLKYQRAAKISRGRYLSTRETCAMNDE